MKELLYFNDWRELNEVLITFGNKVYPKFNNIVILAGGAGSGKDFIINNLLGIEGKILDIDNVKRLALKSKDIRKKIKNEFGVDIRKLNLNIPNQAAKLHDVLNGAGILLDTEEQMYTAVIATPEDRKPNIIFNVTMRGVYKFYDISDALYRMGYSPRNVHLVWIINDIEIAKQQNLNPKRNRIVPNDLLTGTHIGASKTLYNLIKDSTSLEDVIDGDIIFVFNKAYVDTELLYSKNSDLPKNDKPFIINKANFVYIKKQGEHIDVDKINTDIRNKINEYTPNKNLWI